MRQPVLHDSELPPVWADITFVNGRHGKLRVRHGKTTAARRELPLPPRLRSVLETRWQNSGQPSDLTRSWRSKSVTILPRNLRFWALAFRVEPLTFVAVRRIFRVTLHHGHALFAINAHCFLANSSPIVYSRWGACGLSDRR